MGPAIAFPGAQKLFGWFGCGGIHATGNWLASTGFRPGTRFAIAAGRDEFLWGLVLALGFLGPVGPALMVTVMLVCQAHRAQGTLFYSIDGGPEINVLYITGALIVSMAGTGPYSLDHAFGMDSVPQVFTWVLLALGVLGALSALAMRNRSEPPDLPSRIQLLRSSCHEGTGMGGSR